MNGRQFIKTAGLALRRIVNLAYGTKDCFSTRDMFEVLARKDIIAVLISTDYGVSPAY